MRRKYTELLILLITTVLLTGCAAEPNKLPTVPTVTENHIQNTAPVQTLPAIPTEVSEETEPQESATAAPEKSTPYLQRIERSDQSIYEGPGYDYCFVDTVRQRGTYTIVEEVRDSEGNLWGRLKSGIGWVDLTEIQSEGYKNTLISANYADEDFVLHGAYHHYTSGQEYSIPIAIRAYGRIQNVKLYGIELTDAGLLPGADLIILPEMTEEMPLVAELAFPGDMSMYGIQFVDEDGRTHVYSIHISGRNGALVLVEE